MVFFCLVLKLGCRNNKLPPIQLFLVSVEICWGKGRRVLADPYQSATSRSHNSISIPTRAAAANQSAFLSGLCVRASYKMRLLGLEGTLLRRIYPQNQLLAPVRNTFSTLAMTLEEVLIQEAVERAQRSGKALEEVLVSAKENQSITVGVYESAKVMNV